MYICNMESEATSTKRYVGQVKWFNNKAGYGFITMKNDEGEMIDIFTHYSTVRIEQTQYKYLVQGEYVEFILTNATNTEHKYQATDVTGIDGGKLMCETRQANRSTMNVRNTYPKREGALSDGFTKVRPKRRLQNVASM